MRAVVFANGDLLYPDAALKAVRTGDLIIAADGGALHCQELGLRPDLVVGDFDSLSEADLERLKAEGASFIRYPARKDYNDLELALRHAVERGVDQILVLGALGSRWDQTLANVLLLVSAPFDQVRITLEDGPQEIHLIRSGESLVIEGQPGDTVSLLPLTQMARDITTEGLEYPLEEGSLYMGGTRGISNVLLGETARVTLGEGLLFCVVIHGELPSHRSPAR